MKNDPVTLENSMAISYNISLLGVYPREMKIHVHRVQEPKIRNKLGCPSIDKQIKNPVIHPCSEILINSKNEQTIDTRNMNES